MMFRAMQAANISRTPSGTTINRSAALTTAAFTVVSRVFNRTDYPGVNIDYAARYNEALAQSGSDGASVALGRQAAELVLAERSSDGWNNRTGYVPDSVPGAWQPTGGTLCDTVADAATPHWGMVRPFALQSGRQFRPPLPANARSYAELLGSSTYQFQVDHVRRLGGHPGFVFNERNAEQTQIAWFWANDLDGTYKPPGQLLEHTRIVAESRGLSQDDKVRLFAWVAIALADASIAAWDTKFLTVIDLWRPIHGVNHAFPGDNWLPLSADRNGNQFTPCFPAWVSGHATFGGAWAGAMSRFFGTDSVTFTGTTEDPHARNLDGTFVRRTFSSFSQAANENAISRVYLGVHYRFDGDLDGRNLGANVANAVISRPLMDQQGTIVCPVPYLVDPTFGTLNNCTERSADGTQGRSGLFSAITGGFNGNAWLPVRDWAFRSLPNVVATDGITGTFRGLGRFATTCCGDVTAGAQYRNNGFQPEGRMGTYSHITGQFAPAAGDWRPAERPF